MVPSYCNAYNTTITKNTTMISIKRTFSALCLVCLFTALLPSSAQALKARAAVLMDMQSGEVLFSHNPNKAIHPASLTKVLTMFVALDYVKNGYVKLSDFTTISANAAKQGGSRMSLRRGEKIRLNRLLYGMAVSSGNDASMAIAEHIAGSNITFVRLMNRYAKSLGMKHSYFQNPHGLPAKKQITTALDMAILARAYLRAHPDALRYHNETRLRHNGRLTTNKNPLLGEVEGADGLKTGWIIASGYNIISTVKRDGRRLVAVVLGAKNASIREQDTISLIEAGFDSLEEGLPVKNILEARTYHVGSKNTAKYTTRKADNS